MYDLPFVPSERPLNRHLALLRQFVVLSQAISEHSGIDQSVDLNQLLRMMDSMNFTIASIDSLQAKADSVGLPVDHNARMLRVDDPYRYEYVYS